MIKMKKFLALCFLITALAISLSISAAAADDSGIGVRIGEQSISFADAQPTARDGRVYVPFRAVFEALGAQVSYDEAANSVTAVRGDTTAVFTIGQTGMVITQNGTEKAVLTDAVSYAEDNRTMVSVRYAAEAFGCNVGWDNNSKTVLILDVDTLLDANDARYTLMDQYLAFSQKYQNAAYAIDGTFDMSMEITNGVTVTPITANGTMTGIVQSPDVNFEMDFTIDLSDIMATMGEIPDDQTQQMVTMFMNTKFEYIANLSDGKIYMRSPLFAMSLGMDSQAWLSMDLNEMMNGYGDLVSISQTTEFTDYMKHMMGSFTLEDTETLNVAAQILSSVNTYCRDAAFVKDGNIYTSTLSFEQDGIAAQGNIAFTMSNGQVSSVSMTGSVTSDEMSVGLDYAFDDTDHVTMTMTINEPEVAEMSLQFEMDYTGTDEAPIGAPEEGSVILPMESMM